LAVAGRLGESVAMLGAVCREGHTSAGYKHGIDEHDALEEVRSPSGRGQSCGSSKRMTHPKRHPPVGLLRGEEFSHPNEVVDKALPAIRLPLPRL